MNPKVSNASKPTKINLVAQAHAFVREHLPSADFLAVDATAGNGHDTLFLAQLAGENARIAAFDVQAAAIEATRSRLEKNACAGKAELYLCGHEKMADLLGETWRGKTQVVFFNLGYLPKSNHAVTTLPETTLAALDAAWDLLMPGGVISLTIYTRHVGGFEESERVNTWLESMRSRAEIFTCGSHNPVVPWWAGIVKRV